MERDKTIHKVIQYFFQEEIKGKNIEKLLVSRTGKYGWFMAEWSLTWNNNDYETVMKD